MADTNQYKQFRSTFSDLPQGFTGISDNILSKRYDEPTYMTFRVLFGQNSDIWSGTTLLNTNYDRMPHPLFINSRKDANILRGEGENGRLQYEFDREIYTTRDYLRDSNEFTREQMLQEFINVWEDLQDNFQWYFQSIEGVSDLLKIEPGRGRRVSQDLRLTFNMIEGIDQRISYLLKLYRKIAWDDLYQRWVLPDLMRFFDIQIFITEFRTFHQSTVVPKSNNPVFLEILNGILPTYLIQCEMCEFDINSFNYSYRDNLNVSEDPQMSTISFQVKVGNVNQISTFPLFQHFIFDDRKINGLERTKEKGLVKDINGRVTNATEEISGNQVPKEQDFDSTKSGDIRYANLDQKAQDTFFDQGHRSTGPYIQSNPGNIRNSSPNYSTEVNSVNPIEPNTWVGNAINFGKAYATNFVEQKIDQAKLTKIPGLGFSFNEAIAAIESKSFVSVLGLIRRGIADSLGDSERPSELLDQKIDNTFKQFLVGLSESEATDGDNLELKEMAIKVLSDRGKWEEVKDLSYATDLRGPGQKEIGVSIEGGNQYKQTVNIATNNDRSLATDLDGEANLVNTGKITGNQTISEATTTNQNDLKGKQYIGIGIYSRATEGDTFIEPGQILEAQPSSATRGKKIESDLKTTPILSSGTDSVVEGKGPNTDINSESTDGSPIEKGEITGQGGLSENINEGGEITGQGGLSEEINEGGEISGQGRLGNEIEKNYNTTDELSDATDDSPIEKGEITGQGGLGEEIDNIKFTGQGGLGNEIDVGINFSGSGGLGNTAKGDLKTTDEISKATEKKKIETKQKERPEVSKATNNKEEK